MYFLRFSRVDIQYSLLAACSLHIYCAHGIPVHCGIPIDFENISVLKLKIFDSFGIVSILVLKGTPRVSILVLVFQVSPLGYQYWFWSLTPMILILVLKTRGSIVLILVLKSKMTVPQFWYCLEQKNWYCTGILIFWKNATRASPRANASNNYGETEEVMCLSNDRRTKYYMPIVMHQSFMAIKLLSLAYPIIHFG